MTAFLDSSALVKLYRIEAGSSEIEACIKSYSELCLSEIARLEFRSAIYKKVRTKELALEAAKEFIACFTDDYHLFTWVGIDESVINCASELLSKYGEKGLRTLDSIQIASALQLKLTDLLIISSDVVMNKILSLEGLSVFE
jgi:predicted nucleic acid-binding protein